MRYSHSVLMVAIVGASLGFGEPAFATSLQRVDLPAGKVSVAFGLLGGAVDAGLTDRWSLGVGGFFYPQLLRGIGVRSTYRLLGEPGGPCMGLTLGAGYMHGGLFSADDILYVHPAAIVAWPVGGSGFTLRGLIGPAFYQYAGTAAFLTGTTYRSGQTVAWIPDVELAYAWGPKSELTLGGNALVGWRGLF